MLKETRRWNLHNGAHFGYDQAGSIPELTYLPEISPPLFLFSLLLHIFFFVGNTVLTSHLYNASAF